MSVCALDSGMYSLEGKTHIYLNHANPGQIVVGNRRAKYCQYMWVKREYGLENGEGGSGI